MSNIGSRNLWSINKKDLSTKKEIEGKMNFEDPVTFDLVAHTILSIRNFWFFPKFFKYVSIFIQVYYSYYLNYHRYLWIIILLWLFLISWNAINLDLLRNSPSMSIIYSKLLFILLLSYMFFELLYYFDYLKQIKMWRI